MKHKFKLTRLWVASLLLLFGFSPNAWAGPSICSSGTTYIYLDYTNCNWSSNQVYLVWTSNNAAYRAEASRVDNTKLIKWSGNTNWSIDGIAWMRGDWGASAEDTWANISQWATDCTSKYTGNYEFKNGDYAVFSATGTSKNWAIVPTYMGNSYTSLNKTQTLKIYVKKAGENSYSEATSGTYGTFTPEYYKMTTASTASKQTTLSSNKGDAAITSTFKLTESNTTAGYTFKGWGESASATPDGQTTKTYTVSDAKTIYAFFEENAYYIKHGWKDGADASWSYKPLTANGDGTFYIDDWYGGTGCNWKFLSDGNEKWIEKPTLDNEPAKGDKCIFTLNPTANSGNGTITITPKTYTLTLDNKGGSTEPSSLVVTYGKTCPDFTIPTKTGYKFSGYNKQNTTSVSSRVINQGKTFKATQTGYTQESKWIRDEAVILDAIWTAEQYTITYKDQGDVTFTGSWIDITYPTKHTYDATTTLVAPNNKTGYTFGGWYKTSDCSGEAVTEIGGTDYTNNFTLYAKWNPTTTTITIYKNDQGVAYQDEPTIQMTATYDAVMPATAATNWTRTGYNLNNFYLERGCTNIITSTNTKYASSKTYNEIVYTNSANPPVWKYTANNTLAWYARWQAKTYTITFNPNGGSSEQYTKTATYDSRTNIATCTKPTHATANFAGYYLNAEGTGDPLYNAECALQSNVSGYTDASGNWIHDGDVEVFAKWTSSYVVTLNNMDATSAGTQNVEVEQGKTTGLTSPITCPEKTGYTFGGYFTAASGEGTKVIGATGSWVIPAEGYIDNEGKWIPANGAEFKAYWIANKTKVTFEKQSGTGGTYQVTLTYNSTNNMENITIPTRTGYTFGGYFTEAEGAGTQLITNEGAWIPNVSGYTGEMSNEKPKWMKTTTTNLTLYAKWTAITYTINYEGNGATSGSTESSTHTYDVAKALTTNGFTRAYTVTYNYNGATSGNETASAVANYTFAHWTCSVNESTYTNGQSVTNLASTQDAEVTMTAQWNSASVTLPTPQKTGYNFTGWYNNEERIGGAGESYTPEANITLTAQWTPKQYTITLDAQGGEGGSASVTATFDAAMPTISTLPTRVGYKFNGYWDAASNGTKYYNADGTSARTWNKDANATLYAQWTQLYCFIEGRFHIATDKTRTSWINTFDNGDWNVSSTKIRFEWNETKKRYELATNATLKDLSGKISGYNPDFFIKQSTSGSSLQNEKSYNHDGTLSSEEGVKNAMNAAGDKYCKFNSQDKSGYVTICFDEKDIWFELEKIDLHDVKITTYGGGSVDPSGSYKIGEITWTINATPWGGYKFDGWTVSGGAKVADKNSASTTVTATGDGEVSANFQQLAKIYFQKTNDWETNPAYIYFYNSNYYDNNNGTGSDKSKCVYGPVEMAYIGNEIFDFSYDVEEMKNRGWDGQHVAITHKSQSNWGNFNDNNRVIYCNNFDVCGNTLIKMGEFHESLNSGTAHYYYYSLENMSGAPSSYYIKFNSEGWKSKDENMFQDAKEYTVIKQYTAGAEDEFQVWHNACGQWYGMNATVDHDITNWQMRDNDRNNAKFKAWKTGGYSFKFDINSKQISVTYLGDITVANFPGEVSTFVNRQHKIKPDVTLRNGTAVTDVTITVTHESGDENIATYEQNGTNLVITGKALGSETVTVTYKNNKSTPYVVERTLKVNVAEPIIIQATLNGKSATEDDDYWSNTGLVHIHFWGTDATKTQDMDMSYNKDTKVFSVTAPKIDGFSFMFWYGEDINQSASEQWRKTNDITNCTTNTCYSISYGKDNNTKRTATPKDGGGLCTTDEYYVEITMKNGNTYKSNTISNLSDTVSFFAPKDNDATYMGGTVRIVHNGAVSNPVSGFTEAGVYVATINNDATGFESKKPYTGKYYIRTDGAHGAWGDYKTDPDNLMTSFTPRAEKGETYSYYWVKNVAKTGTGTDGKVNVKADVANDYNDNLANMVENDKFTDGGGYIYQSTNGANVRFSYEPTTNEFKRAIIGGSTDDNFLNIYSKDGGRLFADKDCTKELNANADLSLSKFSDVSDWVYEKVVYAKADGSHATNVILKSVYNGQTTHLLGYNKNEKGEDTDDPKPLEVLGATSNGGTYALRISYDYKRNRLMASWEPGSIVIEQDQVIDADVLFIQKEASDGTIDGTDVAQITYTQTGIDNNAKLTSLKNIMYILEVTPTVISGTSADNQLYWFSLPFDCNINDIFGVEDYVTLNANGQATAGTWGIQRYDGATRASHGWFQDDNPEGFWRWMKRSETLVAGTGYVLVFDKTNASSWKSIGIEEPCEESDPQCEDGKKTVEQKIKRLYFPSIGTSFEISYSGESSSVTYTDNPCNVEKRKEYDGNWKVIGPKSYNNIGVDNTAEKNLTFYYTYNQSAVQGHRYSEKQTIAGSEEFKSFHSYMTQFGGKLTWKPFTKSSDVTPTAKAPYYTENPEFQGGMLTIELRNATGEELNHTFINLSKNGTTGFDQNLDLTKITENCAQIASVSEDVLYAGNTLPLDIEMVPLNVKVVANGTYDIALEQSLEGLEVRLYDAFEQTTTPLDMMSATVTLDKGEYKDRFFLQFVQKSPLTPTNFNGDIKQFNLPTDKTQKLLINDNIYLINGGRIYNVLGVGE